MAKISNTTVYPTVTPEDNDLLILTDATDSNKTKTVLMSGVKSYLNVDTFNATGTVTSTQILNSFTQPVILIPGVAGKHIVPISMVLTYVPDTTAYPPANEVLVTFGTPSSSSIWGRIITAYLGVTTRTSYAFPNSWNGNNAPGIYTTGAGGDNFLFSTASANPTLGDGSYNFNIMYRLVNA